MTSLSSSSPSSSSSTDSVENSLTALILHPNITLPPLIPSPISQKFTDFSTFTNFPNPFSQILSSTSSFSIPLLPPPIPLRIVNEDDFLNDRDDLPIAYLIPRRSRSQVKKKPSIPAKDTVSSPPPPIISTPRTPHTRGKKQLEDAKLSEALRANKRKRVVIYDTTPPPVSSPTSSSDLLLRSVMKPNAVRAKSSKSSVSTPASKASSSSKTSPTVKAFPSKVSPSSSTRSKKQVSKPVSSDSSDSDFNLFLDKYR
ncbi:hypothetical protein P3L10_016492 [Capsicum annuum]